jgi:hypothetical protein
MPGAQCARSLAGQKKQAMPVTVTTVTPEITRHSPHNGFTVSFVLSPVTGLCCHRHLRKSPFANLTPASGCQDHTTSPSAPAPLVFGTARVHRIPPPTSVTIAKRPSEPGGTEMR